MTNIKYLHLTTGYVESFSVGSVIVRHENGFVTAEEAIVEFSAVLKLLAEEHQRESIQYNRSGACCKAAIVKDPAVPYCSKCGRKLTEDEIEIEDVIELWSSIECGDLDNLGQDFEHFRKHGWEVPCGNFTPGQMASVTDFRPVVSGLEDEEARSVNNEIFMTAIGEPCLITRKSSFDKTQLPSSFIFFDDESDEAKYDRQEQSEESEEKEATDEDGDEDFDSSISRSNSDYIFAIVEAIELGEPGKYFADITPRAYFEANKCLYDQHLPIKVTGWGCEMEGVYSPNVIPMSDPNAMMIDLRNQGFTWCPNLTHYLAGLNQSVWTPQFNPHGTLVFRVGTAMVPAHLGRCPETDDCKNTLGAFCLANASMIVSEFGKLSVNHELPKNWKRTAKRKAGLSWIRTFETSEITAMLETDFVDTIVSIALDKK